MKRQKIGTITIVVALLSLFLVSACNSAVGTSAQDYPQRNMEILVGHGAGGGTDLFARAMAKELEKILGININVVNQEGGAGAIALQNAFNKPADGYSLVADSSFPIITANGTNRHGLDEFEPVARVQSDTYALWVKTDQFKDIDAFIQAAQDQPGSIRVGGVATGMDEIVTHLFAKEAGIDLNYVPMKGAGENHAGVLGGHLDAMMDKFGPVISLWKEGKIKPLVVFTDERLEDFPDVPTSVEKGWNVTDGVERGFMVKKGTDPKIVSKLENAIKQAMETENYQQYEKASYLYLRDGWLDAADYREKLIDDTERYKKIVSELQGQ